ncbi:MAG: Uncharacterised protein [Hyphomonas sp. TMED17]|nr:MAG: Uncharacterised protein [Hyphomonas sp. TMED17]
MACEAATAPLTARPRSAVSCWNISNAFRSCVISGLFSTALTVKPCGSDSGVKIPFIFLPIVTVYVPGVTIGPRGEE